MHASKFLISTLDKDVLRYSCAADHMPKSSKHPEYNFFKYRCKFSHPKSLEIKCKLIFIGNIFDIQRPIGQVRIII